MRFLVGTDGSTASAAALDLVRALPLRPTDEVILASVADTPIGLATYAGPPATLGWYDQLHAEVLDHSQRTVAEGVKRLAASGRVSAVVIEGHPVSMLERLARERAVDVVIVGAHGRGMIETLLMGSVSQGLLHSRVPALAIARPIRRGLRTVLLGVDGSDGSRAAARCLADLPLPVGTEVVGIAVVPSHRGPFGRAWSDELFPRIQAAEQSAAKEALDEAEAALRDRGLQVRTEVRAGRAKVTLVEAAAETGADLVVVGARGLGGFEELVLGSVSNAVARAAHCSVLVVHQR